jgi:hypothetical protein
MLKDSSSADTSQCWRIVKADFDAWSLHILRFHLTAIWAAHPSTEHSVCAPELRRNPNIRWTPPCQSCCLCGISQTRCKTSPLLRIYDQGCSWSTCATLRSSNCQGRLVFHLVLKADVLTPLPCTCLSLWLFGALTACCFANMEARVLAVSTSFRFLLPQTPFLPFASSKFKVFNYVMCTIVSRDGTSDSIYFRLLEEQGLRPHTLPWWHPCKSQPALANLSWLFRKSSRLLYGQKD